MSSRCSRQKNCREREHESKRKLEVAVVMPWLRSRRRFSVVFPFKKESCLFIDNPVLYRESSPETWWRPVLGTQTTRRRNERFSIRTATSLPYARTFQDVINVHLEVKEASVSSNDSRTPTSTETTFAASPIGSPSLLVSLGTYQICHSSKAHKRKHRLPWPILAPATRQAGLKAEMRIDFRNELEQDSDEQRREESESLGRDSETERQVTMTTKAKAWMTQDLKALGDARSGGPWTTQDLEGHWMMQDLETIRPRAEFVTEPFSLSSCRPRIVIKVYDSTPFQLVNVFMCGSWG
ncbi:hypothetical protein C8J56DRAFT_906340 [Mycena floridula]|nr:hypothetical protein C8J56DRAFT_906340 [Mycena floridula]